MAPQIYVVNHTRELLELFHELLSDEGYQVSLNAYDAANLQAIQHMHPDLVIVDHIVRRDDQGWRLLNALKQGDATSRIPIIVCTTNPRLSPELLNYVQSGEVQVVQEPFDIEDFLGVVKQALDGVTYS